MVIDRVGKVLFCKKKGTFLLKVMSENCKVMRYRLKGSDFSYAALSSIAVAAATPHSSALHMKKSSCVNVVNTWLNKEYREAIKLPDK